MKHGISDDIQLSRVQREAWFRNTLDVDNINANKGKINCAHCSLKVDDRIRDGKTNGESEPVPVENANLFTLPKKITKRNSRSGNFNIGASTTEDERILTRCVVPHLENKMSVVYKVGDEDQNEIILDLTDDNLDKTAAPQSIRLMRVDPNHDILNE